MGTRRSPIWDMPSPEFRRLVKHSSTAKEVLAAFGLRNAGANYYTLKRRLLEEGLATEQFSLAEVNKIVSRRRSIPLKEILVENSTYSNRTHLKVRLIRAGKLMNACGDCGQEPEWNSKPLVLVLDHINGVHNDNRLKNLRLLCPNCNSQQDTFAGRRSNYR